MSGDGYEIWIEDPATIKNHEYPHGEVEARAEHYFQENGIQGLPTLPGFWIQDDEGFNYLLVNNDTAKEIESECRQKEEIPKWEKLIQNYKISSIIGNIGEGKIGSGEELWAHVPLPIMYTPEDPTQILSENDHLLEMAKENKMTNNQFIRFRLLVKSALEAGQAVNYQEIIDHVLQENNH